MPYFYFWLICLGCCCSTLYARLHRKGVPCWVIAVHAHTDLSLLRGGTFFQTKPELKFIVIKSVSFMLQPFIYVHYYSPRKYALRFVTGINTTIRVHANTASQVTFYVPGVTHLYNPMHDDLYHSYVVLVYINSTGCISNKSVLCRGGPFLLMWNTIYINTHSIHRKKKTFALCCVGLVVSPMCIRLVRFYII